MKTLEPTIKNKPMIKIKVKDSDDEDYMPWKKPDITAPIVTFTPPPDDATPGTSFSFKPNILTKKHLETFNVRLNQQMHIARAMFADGDDGFESLNGYNSNGSDGENKTKDIDVQGSSHNIEAKGTSKQKLPDNAKLVKEVPENNIEVRNDKKVDKNAKEDDEKSIDPDSDGGAPTSSPSAGKRIGVRFRSSWVQDTIRRESSDDDFASVKKKQKVIYYSSNII